MMKRRSSGFTIVEMMISMTILLFVVGAIFAVNNQSWQYQRQMDIQADALQVARKASEQINRVLTGASNLAYFKPAAFNVGGSMAGQALGTSVNFLYFAKPSAFAANGEVTEYDFYFYYLTSPEALRMGESSYTLREYRIRRVLEANLANAFAPGATLASIQAANPNASATDRVVTSGIDGRTVTSVKRPDGTTFSVPSGTFRGFIVEANVTEIKTAANAGDSVLYVQSVANTSANEYLSLGSEELKVRSVDAASTPKRITLDSAVRHAHALEQPVANVTDGVILYIQTAVMGRQNEGIVRVPLDTRIHLRNS